MKIRTQAGILIFFVTFVPLVFMSMIGYLEYGLRKKISRSINATVKNIYSCLEKDDWTGFVPDSYILNAFNILSVEISSENKQHFFCQYIDQNAIIQKDLHGITNYVISLSELENKYKKKLSSIPGVGKHDAVITMQMPMDAFVRPRDTVKKIFDIGIRITILGIVVSAVFLIISLTRMTRKMQTVIKGWEENDFKAMLEPGSNDEITEIVKSFNKAGKKIRENYALRDRFIMGLSHDFKTPLALIHGYTELLQKQIPAHDEKSHKNLFCIEKNVDQLDIMLSELLDFVAIESGEIPFYPEKINITSWLKGAVISARNDSVLLGKEVTGNILLDDELFVIMDNRLCERAFSNLIQNSLRYTGDDGVIKVAAKKVSGKILVSVSDNGAGIEKKDLPHIFDLFYRASPERDKKGMGIGLSIVRTVALRHGWNLKAENVKPHGACFTIEIPYNG